MTEIISTIHFSTPKECITNDELVNSYNEFVAQHNFMHPEQPLRESSSEFIYNASGIKKRYVYDKKGILDPRRMHPLVTKRSNSEMSMQAEFSVHTCLEMFEGSNICPHEVNAVIVSCSNFQRAYPGIAAEVANSLGIKSSFTFDMNAGCASAVFGIAMAKSIIRADMADKVLVVTPELYSFHSNFKDRKSHFIFGDGCSAVIVERYDESKSGLLIKSVKLKSKFSNNIRNNFGFMNYSENDFLLDEDKKFFQAGRNVREEVVPLTAEHINSHMLENNWCIRDIKRLWLHQANKNMLLNIGKEIFSANMEGDPRLPLTIEKYANTAGSSVIGCISDYSSDLESGNKGIIAAFGAGYSVGSILVEKR